MLNFNSTIKEIKSHGGSPLWNAAESYLDCGQRSYRVGSLSGRKVELIEATHSKSKYMTLLKVISYASIIFPLLALAVKIAYRSHYDLIRQEESAPPIQPAVHQPVSPAPRLEENKPSSPSKEAVQTLPLEKTGALSNGGSTCYIGAILQCLRSVPTFSSYLDKAHHPLHQKKKESDVAFSLRQKTQEEIKRIALAINEGKTVSGNEMEDLRQLLRKCGKEGALLTYLEQDIPASGDGALDTLFSLLVKILELPQIQRINPNERDKALPYRVPYLNIATSSLKQEQTHVIENAINHPGTDQSTEIPPILSIYFSHTDQHAKIDYNLENVIRIKMGTYRLVSFVERPRWAHYIAHVRDLSKEEERWVTFNDGSVYPTKNVGEAAQGISMAFYEKISHE